MSSSYNIQRFIDAQKNIYYTALAEIKNGRKRNHWMWYIFPQVKGLGFSGTARYYGIDNLDEAQQYLNHEVLGSRLIELSKALLDIKSNDARQIFGSPDDMKLRSSMTLFSQVENSNLIFKKVLQKFFKSEPDQATLRILNHK